MRTIKRIATSLPFLALTMALLITLLAALARAQDSQYSQEPRILIPETSSQKPPGCRAAAMIVNVDWEDDSKFRKDFLSEGQARWWNGVRHRRYAGVCLTRDSEKADYVIAWSQIVKTETVTRQVPRETTTRHRGDVYGRMGSGGGTYEGTSRSTTWEEKAYEEPREWVVKVDVHKIVEVEGERKVDKTPAFSADARAVYLRLPRATTSVWTPDMRDIAAFEKAVKFIGGR